MKCKCIDCFCGAGGLALGLVNAGFELCYSFDIDPKAIGSICSNTKYIPSHLTEVQDIYQLDSDLLLQRLNLKIGELDLLAGGPPCQGFSIQRGGEDTDERNDLVRCYIQIVKNIRPKFFLMENVPGIIGKRGTAILKTNLEIIENEGYFVHQQLLDAQNYEVPQRRKRVIIVGERCDHDSPLFHFPKPSDTILTVRDAIGFLPPPPDDYTDHPNYLNHRRDRLTEGSLKRIQAVKEGQGRDFLPEDLLLPCHKVSSSVIGHRNVFGRMCWDKVAPTITARFDSFSRGMFGHPVQDRTISLREGALLQTFPIDFKFIGNKVEVARQIGNAVPVKLAEHIGNSIINALKRW
ncbi:MAG: DNA cytosine methyltransferase [Bacteroidales bacterium]|nr:DNA cytosine methyltransferase [Bacteroidales bacterium]